MPDLKDYDGFMNLRKRRASLGKFVLMMCGAGLLLLTAIAIAVSVAP